MVTLQVRHTETVDGARARLARKAEVEGVTITRDQGGRYFASSVSTPGQSHYVTGYSCDCVGFANRGRCKHHSALLAAMGWLDDADPEPTPPVAAVAVVHVPGAWIVGGWLISDGCPVWNPPVTTITIGGEDVLRVTGDGFDVTAHWIEDGHAGDNMTASMPSGLTHRAAVVHWVRALASSVDVDSLLYGAGLHEDRDLWDDLPVGDDADNSLEEVA